MMRVDFHGITGLELGPVKHFPASAECGEFWARELRIVMRDGEYTGNLFSYSGADVLGFCVPSDPALAPVDQYQPGPCAADLREAM